MTTASQDERTCLKAVCAKGLQYDADPSLTKSKVLYTYLSREDLGNSYENTRPMSHPARGDKVHIESRVDAPNKMRLVTYYPPGADKPIRMTPTRSITSTYYK